MNPSSTGSGFEILFSFSGAGIVGLWFVEDNDPRSESLGIFHFAAIVFGEPSLEVIGQADVEPAVDGALEDIDEDHCFSFGGAKRKRRSSFASPWQPVGESNPCFQDENLAS